MTNDQDLRREVVQALHSGAGDKHYFALLASMPSVVFAFDALAAYYRNEAKPVFEGGEAEVIRQLRAWTGDPLIADALALLDAKDAESTHYRNRYADKVADLAMSDNALSEALSRAEQAEAALAEVEDKLSISESSVKFLRKLLDDARDELAAEREAMSGAAANLVGYIEEKAPGSPTANIVRRYLAPFLPAEPAVDPLVEILGEAIGGQFTPGWLEGRTANLRAAIDRAGGVKAVFGEE